MASFIYKTICACWSHLLFTEGQLPEQLLQLCHKADVPALTTKISYHIHMIAHEQLPQSE